MYEVGETCKLKGDTKTEYVVAEVFYEEDNETVKGYHLLKWGVTNHWIRASKVKPRRKRKRK